MKKYKFDLKRALAGEPVINEVGEEIKGFHKRRIKPEITKFPYADSNDSSYTEEGKYTITYHTVNDLYMKYPKLEEGMKILVRDSDDKDWIERIFLVKDKNGLIIAIKSYQRYMDGELYNAVAWKQFKLIEEPAIEITVKINGKEAKLSDISEEIFKKLKNLEQ